MDYGAAVGGNWDKELGLLGKNCHRAKLKQAVLRIGKGYVDSNAIGNTIAAQCRIRQLVGGCRWQCICVRVRVCVFVCLCGNNCVLKCHRLCSSVEAVIVFEVSGLIVLHVSVRTD